VYFLILLSAVCFGSEDLERGKTLYNAYCTSCHTKEEKVTNLPENKNMSEMIEVIRSGSSGMPTYSWMFEDEDLEQIINYMKTLPKQD
jgi:mono/diheme cytochrome c family protein